MRKRLKKLWEICGHVSTAQSVIQWLGLSKYIAIASAAVFGFAAGLWIRIERGVGALPSAIVGLAVFGIVLFAAYLLALARRQRLASDASAYAGNSSIGRQRQTVPKGPHLTINVYGSGNRLAVNDDYFYYSLIIQNTQTLYEARAYELAASLSFEPAVKGNGKPFAMDRALFLRRQPTGPESFSETVNLGMNETAEILLVVMNQKAGCKAIAPNSWPPQPDAPMLSLGEWTCAASVRGVNLRKASRRFKISVQRSRVVIVPF